MINYIVPGYKVLVDNRLSIEYSHKQFKFPKSKKKRIREKFYKNKDNFKLVIVNNSYKIGDTIYLNQLSFDNLNNMFDGKQ